MKQKNRGISLIALVITSIILLVLAGVSIATLTGEDGLLKKAKTGKEKTNQQTATEIINLKITNIQIETYAKMQKMPSLQELADELCKDEKDEIEYVYTTSQKVGENPKTIEVGEASSIFTKLREYPYEFEINRKLQLASIDGVKVESGEETISKEEYDELKAKQEYHVGDVVNYQNIICSGYLTNSKTRLCFTLFLGKDVGNDVNEVEFSTSGFNIRAEGKYLINSKSTGDPATTKFNLAEYFTAFKRGGNAIKFEYNASSAFLVTNNIPVSFEMNGLTITFK